LPLLFVFGIDLLSVFLKDYFNFIFGCSEFLCDKSGCLLFVTGLFKDVFKRISGSRINSLGNKDDTIELIEMKHNKSEGSIISLGDVLDRNDSFIKSKGSEGFSYRIGGSSLSDGISSNKENIPPIESCSSDDSSMNINVDHSAMNTWELADYILERLGSKHKTRD